MSDQATVPQGSNPAADPKGKGKAVAEPGTEMSVDDDESSSEEEVNEEEQPEEEDEDNMEEIDQSNIIADGRRTRGKNIDFQKAAEEAGDDLDEDEDDDDDFHGHEDEDAMQE